MKSGVRTPYPFGVVTRCPDTPHNSGMTKTRPDVSEDSRYNAWVDRAAAIGIQIEAKDFAWAGGDYTIDGMSPDEWLEAMEMD